jgi:hypothetical protein
MAGESVFGDVLWDDWGVRERLQFTWMSVGSDVRLALHMRATLNEDFWCLAGSENGVLVVSVVPCTLCVG